MLKFNSEIAIYKVGVKVEISLCELKFGKSVYKNQYRKWANLHLGFFHIGFFYDEKICND